MMTNQSSKSARFYTFSNNCVTRNIGVGNTRLGYLRLTYSPLKLWRAGGEWYHSWKVQRNVDMGGRNWTPSKSLGPIWSYAFYRLVAYHISIGPFTASYVCDRDGYGPIGPVWPRDARERSGFRLYHKRIPLEDFSRLDDAQSYATDHALIESVGVSPGEVAK